MAISELSAIELRRLLLPLALAVWVVFVALFLTGCGQPEDRTPTTGYTQTEENMPDQFEGGAPGKRPTENTEARYNEGQPQYPHTGTPAENPQ